MKYIALLRGINVGGNNKVPMSELKQCFESLGFGNVRTYINSGNVLFEASEQNEQALVIMCEARLEKHFGFAVKCLVVSADAVCEAVARAPKWWGIKDGNKHNAIFVMPPLTPRDVVNEIGEVKPEYEKVAYVGPILFWTAPLKTFGRTRYSKIVGSSSYKFVTIRNVNTTKKLVELSAE